MIPNLKEIANVGWTKNWFGEFSLFTCSFVGDFYYISSIRSVGEGIHHVLYVHRNGITTCYLGKSEMNKFGEFLAKKGVENNEFLTMLASRLKKETDRVFTIMKDPLNSFLVKEKFQTLKKLWPKLEKDNVVVSTRSLGGTTLYKINTENPVVKKIIELNNFLCWQQADEHKEKVVAQ